MPRKQNPSSLFFTTCDPNTHFEGRQGESDFQEGFRPGDQMELSSSLMPGLVKAMLRVL
jgi:hypothetical protein